MIKFASSLDSKEIGLIEYAYGLMAKEIRLSSKTREQIGKILKGIGA